VTWLGADRETAEVRPGIGISRPRRSKDRPMLTGDLKDFSLREILGFLASTSSSGVLELMTSTQHSGVVMHEGGICVALREVGSIRGLVARMLHAGAVDASEVRELADEGAVDAVELAAALARQTASHTATEDVFREHTCEILTWLTRRDGMRFAFARSERVGSWPLSTLDHEEVLDDVETCADGWAELSDIAGDLTRVCSPIPDAPSGDGILLTGEQWRVLSMIDGRRSLADLIELCGVGYLETCRQLRQLVDDGLVEVLAPGTRSQVQDLLASYDIAVPMPTSVTDVVEPALTSLEGDDPAADPGVSPPLRLPVAQDDDDPADEAEAAGGDDADVADVAGDVVDDDATDDANRQLLRRLMSRRSAGV
jgi:hypothetical protein